MATRTTNLSLIKPDYTDSADIAVLNANSDTLDTTIAGLQKNPILAWVASTTYTVGNIVVYDKKIYQCITANSDAEFTKSKWDNIGGDASEAISAHNTATDAHSTLFAAKQDKLADTVDYVVDSYTDDDGNWYRKYKSGWIEQGGIVLKADFNSSYAKTVSFLKPFGTSKPMITGCANATGDNSVDSFVSYRDISATVATMTYRESGTANYLFDFVVWYATGQGAE